jgi:DNA polymerase III epsilon subunit-like protein
VSSAGATKPAAVPFAWRGHPIAMLDVETTGVDPVRDRIVELACVVGLLGERGGIDVIDRKRWLVNPGRPIPEEATASNGITDAMVADAPPFAEIIGELGPMLHGRIPAAFNERFDREFISAEWLRANGEATPPLWLGRHNLWLDPFLWSRVFHRYVKGTHVHRLTSIALRWGLITEADLAQAHRADFDAELALRVLAEFASREFSERPYAMPTDLGDLLEFQEAEYHSDRGDLLHYFRRKRQERGELAGCWFAPLALRGEP